jgi:protein DGCR14
MTWGTISSTPVALRSAGSIARSGLGDGGGPFRIVDTSHREVLAHKMASRAKRSLSDRAAALDPSKKRSSGSHTLRRSVLDSTGGLRDINDSTRSPRGGGGGAELSPAARTLLGRAGKSTGGSGDQGTDVGRRLRAVARAREVESRDRMRRERWSASPAPSMGFDEHFPDDEFETVRLKGGV